MEAPRIRADYDALTQIAQRFAGEADAQRTTLQSLRQSYTPLEDGDWIGQGARAFFAEMRGSVFPSLTRLAQAMGDAQQSMLRILALVRQAEGEAARALNGQPGAATEPVTGGAPATGGAPPPRIYVVNGINNRRSSDPSDRMNPNDSMVKMREYLIAHGYDPDNVVVTPPVYNTNLQGAHVEGTHFDNPLLQPVNWLTGKGADLWNGLTGKAASLVNTVIGVGQVANEYVTGGASQTNRVDAFIREDLVRNPLLPGQGVIFLGHSGGGAIVANLATRYEGDLVARQGGGSTPLDVQGVVTVGSPVVNYDAASKVAPVVMIKHADDILGVPYIRSNESRSTMLPALVSTVLTPTMGAPLAVFGGIELATRNAGASDVISLNDPLGNSDAHGSYWQESSTVFQVLRDKFGLDLR